MARLKVVQVICDGHPMPGWVPTRLGAGGVDLTVAISWNKEDLARHAADADVVWAYGGRDLLKGDNLSVLERCGAILRTGSGTDNIDVPLATKMGIIVANTPQAVTDAVSDHAISLLFSLVRQVVRHDRLIRCGEWNYRRGLPLHRYRGATLGLVGFGRIAQMLVHKLSGFEMQFMAYDPYVTEAYMAERGVVKAALPDMLAELDYLVLLCPLTTETRHIIGETELRLMQPHAVLVNASRGAVIDEPALVQALQEERIAGAALDVLMQEPPAAENPLLGMDNVIFTPHYAGYSDDYLTDNYAASVDALLDFAARRWPFSVVNPQVEPRWGQLAARV
ncbi:MAG TPA: C-terminal binding protein [Anaerolineae bacterium]